MEMLIFGSFTLKNRNKKKDFTYACLCDILFFLNYKFPRISITDREVKKIDNRGKRIKIRLLFQ